MSFIWLDPKGKSWFPGRSNYVYPIRPLNVDSAREIARKGWHKSEDPVRIQRAKYELSDQWRSIYVHSRIEMFAGQSGDKQQRFFRLCCWNDFFSATEEFLGESLPPSPAPEGWMEIEQARAIVTEHFGDWLCIKALETWSKVKGVGRTANGLRIPPITPGELAALPEFRESVLRDDGIRAWTRTLLFNPTIAQDFSADFLSEKF